MAARCHLQGLGPEGSHGPMHHVGESWGRVGGWGLTDRSDASWVMATWRPSCEQNESADTTETITFPGGNYHLFLWCKKYNLQVCMPVGSVPPAHWPYSLGVVVVGWGGRGVVVVVMGGGGGGGGGKWCCGGDQVLWGIYPPLTRPSTPPPPPTKSPPSQVDRICDTRPWKHNLRSLRCAGGNNATTFQHFYQQQIMMALLHFRNTPNQHYSSCQKQPILVEYS